jgi:hypothetical protein
MARRQGGTLGGFTPLSTPNAPTGLSVSAEYWLLLRFRLPRPPTPVTALLRRLLLRRLTRAPVFRQGLRVLLLPITISPGGGTFKIRAQAVNGFGPGRLTEFLHWACCIFSGAALYAWGPDNSPKASLGSAP